MLQTTTGGVRGVGVLLVVKPLNPNIFWQTDQFERCQYNDRVGGLGEKSLSKDRAVPRERLRVADPLPQIPNPLGIVIKVKKAHICVSYHYFARRRSMKG